MAARSSVRNPRSATAEGAEDAEVENHHADHATATNRSSWRAQRLRERLFPGNSEILSQGRDRSDQRDQRDQRKSLMGEIHGGEIPRGRARR
jgi:hypothetical protein